MIDLQKLKHAIAVAQAGSYSMAAKNISISQSALTRSVQLLEQDYDVRLFERGRSGARLTLEGARFIQIAENAVRLAQNTHEQLALVPTTQMPPVSFGMGPMTAASVLPALLPLLLNDGIRYRIKIQSNSALQLMLRQGDLDFFVGGSRKGGELHALANQFIVQPIATIPMNFLVREGHPLLQQTITPELLSKYPTAAGSLLRESLGIPFIEQFGLQEPTIELDDYHILFQFVRDTDYVLMCNRMLSRTSRRYRLTPLPTAINIVHHMEWAIISSAKVDVSAPARRARSLTAEVISQQLADESGEKDEQPRQPAE